MTVHIRPLSIEDLPDVAGRLRAEFPSDAADERNIARQVWGDPHYEPMHNLGAWDDDGLLRGVLLGVVRSSRAWIKALTVGPEPSVPEALLESFESVLAGSLVVVIDVSGSSPVYLTPGIDPCDTRSTLFFTSHGFRKVGEAYNMVCDLTHQPLDTADAEQALTAAGYRLARLTADDQLALTEFVDRRFSANWTAEALDALHQRPHTCHVAWFDGRIVGFAAAEVTNPGWFGPMGTHARHRKHGIGRVLLLRCLADLRDRGYREATIGWVGPMGFYQRACQARVSRLFWQYRKHLAPPHDPMA
ncbi:MAG: GNAT family N-acetyltransferase [Armatimonadetes bacterium]|nr:GNAT family N-acetyltransferase [Armatimonadota bacterium]